MTQVIYARVPDALKQAADAVASERGTTLAATISDLLRRGLESLTDVGSVSELQHAVRRLSTEKAEIEAARQKATSELGTLRALAERTAQRVGVCPNDGCRLPITGYDLLATGSCSNCACALTSLLCPGPTASEGTHGMTGDTGLNERDFLLLLGAVGAAVAVAYVSAKS
jgi:hypothetical protein